MPRNPILGRGRRTNKPVRRQPPKGRGGDNKSDFDEFCDDAATFQKTFNVDLGALLTRLFESIFRRKKKVEKPEYNCPPGQYFNIYTNKCEDMRKPTEEEDGEGEDADTPPLQ